MLRNLHEPCELHLIRDATSLWPLCRSPAAIDCRSLCSRSYRLWHLQRTAWLLEGKGGKGMLMLILFYIQSLLNSLTRLSMESCKAASFWGGCTIIPISRPCTRPLDRTHLDLQMKAHSFKTSGQTVEYRSAFWLACARGSKKSAGGFWM